MNSDSVWKQGIFSLSYTSFRKKLLQRFFMLDMIGAITVIIDFLYKIYRNKKSDNEKRLERKEKLRHKMMNSKSLEDRIEAIEELYPGIFNPDHPDHHDPFHNPRG